MRERIIKDLKAAEHNIEQARQMQPTKRVDAFIATQTKERERGLIILGREISEEFIRKNTDAYDIGLKYYEEHCDVAQV